MKNMKSKLLILFTLLILLGFVDTAKAWTCGSALVDSRDDKSYSTVLIGAQCWMQQNLNVGTMVTGATTQGTSCASIQKYCYSNNEANCSTDGALYQWDQTMCGLTTAGSQGICPLGWHVPTHDEFTTLERSVCTSGTCETDFPYNNTTSGWLGTNEGTILKDMSGLFRAILTGYRIDASMFIRQGQLAYFWSSVESGANAWRRSLGDGSSTVNRNSVDISKEFGYSVRCLQDIAVVYNITSSSDSNGSISPNGATSVEDGSSQTYIITPNTSYKVSDVLVDGVSQGAISSYTFTNVTTDHTISVIFELATSGGGSGQGRLQTPTPLTIPATISTQVSSQISEIKQQLASLITQVIQLLTLQIQQAG